MVRRARADRAVKTNAGGAAIVAPGGTREGLPAQSTVPDAAALDETAAKKRTPAAEGAGAANAVKSAGPAAPPPASSFAPNAAQMPAVAHVGTTAANAVAVLFSHNNSTMKFVPEGDTVRVVYDKPRSGLEGLGIKSGTPLFEGKKTGPNSYAGEATTFSRACGAAKFPVAGEAGGGVVTLRGQKPKRDGKCNVTGYTSETLVFEAQGK